MQTSEHTIQDAYQQHAIKLRRLLRDILRDPAEAEEHLQDVFLSFWLGRGFDAQRGTLRSWLCKLARWRAADTLRRKRLEERFTPRWEFEREEEPSPEHILLYQERQQLLRASVAALPPKYYQVLSLWYSRGMAHAEIARYTGLPLGTVKDRLRRALAHLREDLSFK